MAIGTTRLNGRAGVEMNITHYLAGDLSEGCEKVLLSAGSWAYGTGANAVNLIYAANISLANAGPGAETLDLYAGALEEIFSRATMSMTALKFLYIKNTSTDAVLSVGGNSTNDLDIFTATDNVLFINPGGTFLWTDPSAAGMDITTNKNLYLTHDGGGDDAVVVNVIAMGLD